MKTDGWSLTCKNNRLKVSAFTEWESNDKVLLVSLRCWSFGNENYIWNEWWNSLAIEWHVLQVSWIIFFFFGFYLASIPTTQKLDHVANLEDRKNKLNEKKTELSYLAECCCCLIQEKSLRVDFFPFYKLRDWVTQGAISPWFYIIETLTQFINSNEIN